MRERAFATLRMGSSEWRAALESAACWAASRWPPGSGMTLSTAGALAWPKAVKGMSALTVTVKDSHGLAGAVATITVAATA